MKKSVITLFSALLVSSSFAFNGSQNANAADTKGDTKNSTAYIKVKPGNLEIKNATQDITFEAITWNGQQHTPKETSNAGIQIGDYRGSISKGWSLKVQKLQENDGFGSNGIQLAFSAKTKDAGVSTNTSGQNRALNSDSVEIAAVSRDNIKTSAIESNIDLDPSLVVPGSVRIGENDQDKIYQTTLVWSLTTTPENE